MGLVRKSAGVVQETLENMLSGIVPPQHTGGQSNVQVFIRCAGAQQADEVYRQVKLHLLDVNHWHRYISGITAKFHLTDKNGVHTKHQAIIGDHFKIRIPGPRLRTGGGYDWTTVRAVEEKSAEGVDLFFMTAVPSRNPQAGGPEIAHFLQPLASTTFITYKEGRIVRILIRSRNEVPNSAVSGMHDKLRNKFVGFFAGLFFSHLQWAKLARSLLRSSYRSSRETDNSFKYN